LIKQYPSLIHNIQAGISLNLPSINREKGYFADFIPFNLEKKSALFKVDNYFYTPGGYNFLIDRFSQKYFFEEEDEKYNEAENEIIYRRSNNLTLRNSLIYSYAYHKLKKIQSGLKYKDDLLDLRIDHTYQDVPNDTKINFISGDLTHVLDSKYALYAGIDYDFDNSFTKEWRFGLNMHKKCWNYQIRYKESVTPSLTSGGTESITKRGIYLLVQFAHIGGVNYQYVKDFNSKNMSDTINPDDLFDIPVTENEPVVVEPANESSQDIEVPVPISEPGIQEQSIPSGEKEE